MSLLDVEPVPRGFCRSLTTVTAAPARRLRARLSLRLGDARPVPRREHGMAGADERLILREGHMDDVEARNVAAFAHELELVRLRPRVRLHGAVVQLAHEVARTARPLDSFHLLPPCEESSALTLHLQAGASRSH